MWPVCELLSKALGGHRAEERQEWPVGQEELPPTKLPRGG